MQQQILQAELDTVEENLEVLKQQGHDVSRGMLKGLISCKGKPDRQDCYHPVPDGSEQDNVMDFQDRWVSTIFA